MTPARDGVEPVDVVTDEELAHCANSWPKGTLPGAIARELQQARKRQQWQPIETAPRDGTAVLLCWAINADGEQIDWAKNPMTAGVFVQAASYSDVERRWWVYINTPSDAPLHFEPTHWMPLPEPPRAA